MGAFEEITHASPMGFALTWEELIAFAEGITQTYDCVIVGARQLVSWTPDCLETPDSASFKIVLSAFDSTEWSVWTENVPLRKKILDVGLGI